MSRKYATGEDKSLTRGAFHLVYLQILPIFYLTLLYNTTTIFQYMLNTLYIISASIYIVTWGGYHLIDWEAKYEKTIKQYAKQTRLVFRFIAQSYLLIYVLELYKEFAFLAIITAIGCMIVNRNRYIYIFTLVIINCFYIYYIYNINVLLKPTELLYFYVGLSQLFLSKIVYVTKKPKLFRILFTYRDLSHLLELCYMLSFMFVNYNILLRINSE
jgi:hypothetical protein